MSERSSSCLSRWVRGLLLPQDPERDRRWGGGGGDGCLPFTAETAEVRVGPAHPQRLSALCRLVQGRQGITDGVTGVD